MVVLEYAEPQLPEEADPKAQRDLNPVSKFFSTGRSPLEQRIENKKRGLGQQRHPFVGVYGFGRHLSSN